MNEDYPDSPISKKRLLHDLNNLIHAWSATKFRSSANIPLSVLVNFRRDIRQGHYDIYGEEKVNVAKNAVFNSILKGNQRLRDAVVSFLQGGNKNENGGK